MSNDDDGTVDPISQLPPNFVAVPLENFKAAVEFIKWNVMTGLGVPLLERLGHNFGVHIPDENLPPNFKQTDKD
jgi:hypothetical protein